MRKANVGLFKPAGCDRWGVSTVHQARPECELGARSYVVGRSDTSTKRKRVNV